MQSLGMDETKGLLQLDHKCGNISGYISDLQ
eukprot:SAG22_NODE_565_length_9046_cov_142.250475_6_plen_31_part_00